MTPDSGNAAQRLQENETPEEPSMEEILYSIKQIIADDQTGTRASSAREEFTYPDNPSNSNLTIPTADEIELQATLEADLRESADELAVQKPSGNAPTPQATKMTNAAAIREEVSAAGAGMTAEERIRRYRERNRLRIEALADEKSGRKSAPSAPAQNAKIADPVAPRVAQPIYRAPPAPQQPKDEEIAKQMAAILTNERSVEIEYMLKDLMRPTIRQWLNDNLPSMVQRLVREEIQAASRGRRSS